jgi:hypothetical protein
MKNKLLSKGKTKRTDTAKYPIFTKLQLMEFFKIQRRDLDPLTKNICMKNYNQVIALILTLGSKFPPTPTV